MHNGGGHRRSAGNESRGAEFGGFGVHRIPSAVLSLPDRGGFGGLIAISECSHWSIEAPPTMCATNGAREAALKTQRAGGHPRAKLASGTTRFARVAGLLAVGSMKATAGFGSVKYCSQRSRAIISGNAQPWPCKDTIVNHHRTGISIIMGVIRCCKHH